MRLCQWVRMSGFIHSVVGSIIVSHSNSKTRMHSSRMRTACSSGRPGGLHQAPPKAGTPQEQVPWSGAPLEQAIPLEQNPWSRHPRNQTPPGNRHPLGTGTRVGTPQAGTPPHWDQTPPCGQNSWHTLLKILPCPKLRVIKECVMRYLVLEYFS